MLFFSSFFSQNLFPQSYLINFRFFSFFLLSDKYVYIVQIKNLTKKNLNFWFLIQADFGDSIKSVIQKIAEEKQKY